ncbi:MAG: hypothetical protein JO145_16135 [Acidobacteriaceae bacterium]|nr:hypothetical protein [Acidobacteriaceae bacterium]MBV9767000.1 hypothetical protein [Acidobacteriaceae bacterium]
MIARVFVFILVFISAVSALHATSIVILRSPTRVYIGADSRREYRNASGFYPGSVCKIVPAGNLFFVASGLTYANDENVADIGVEAGRGGASVLSAIEIFRSRMQEFLPRALTAEGELRQSLNASRNGLVLESGFVGIQDGLATVSVEWYRRNGTAVTPRVTTDRRTYSSATPGRYDFIFLGKRRAIDQYLGGRMPLVRGDSDAVALITRLIEVEAAESPDTTAPPIDIVELDPSGSRWLQRKLACADSD